MVNRDLPPAPSFAKPVYVAQPNVKEDMGVIAGRERGGRAQANDIIVCTVTWIEMQRIQYRGQDVDARMAKVVKTCEEQDRKKGK